MRFVGLAFIFVSIPVFIALLRSTPLRRDLAVFAIGIMLFCTGPLSLSAAVVSWPMWQGLSKGMIVSLIDTLALALIATRHTHLNRVPFKILIAISVAPTIVSIFAAAVPMAAAFIVFQLAQMILFYVALTGELRRPSAVGSLLNGIAIGLIIQAFYVLNQKLSGSVQAPGTMAHQNILGMMVELSALTLLGAVLEGARGKILYGGLCAAAVILVGGGSRGAMLYSVIGLALVLTASFIRHPTTRKWKVAGVVFLAAVVAVPFAAMTLRERFGDTPVTAEEEQRSAFERAARMIAKDYPLGAGANNFVSVNNTRGYASEAGLDWGPATRSAPAHNAYLLSRAETGWAGEIGLIILLGGLSLAGLKAAFRRRSFPFAGISLGSAGAITAAALHSNYEYAILTLETQRLVYLNAAVIAAALTLHRGGVPKRSSNRRAQVGNAP